MDENKVAVLIEDLMSQFRVFGEGLQQLNEKIDQNTLENRQEHQDMMKQNRHDHIQLQQIITKRRAKRYQTKNHHVGSRVRNQVASCKVVNRQINIH